MTCKGCGRECADWCGDPWCDVCGGVMARPNFLIFRHVATVEGAENRMPIVFDASANHYKFRYPKKQNPHAGEKDVDGEFRRSRILTAIGSLDAVLALALQEARASRLDVPQLSASPFATEDERRLVLLGA